MYFGISLNAFTQLADLAPRDFLIPTEVVLHATTEQSRRLFGTLGETPRNVGRALRFVGYPTPSAPTWRWREQETDDHAHYQACEEPDR